MYGCVHTQVLQAPPHRWSVLWYRLPTHALHGPPGVPTQEARQPVCPQVCTQSRLGSSEYSCTFSVIWRSFWEQTRLSCHLFVPPGCTASRSTPWPTSCSCRQPPASRVPSRPSARASGEREEQNRCEKGRVTCMSRAFQMSPSFPQDCFLLV